MKKRILSLLLALTFVLCALPLSLSAAEVGDGGKFSDWTAKVGAISETEGGVFQINAFDEGEAQSLANKKHARIAMWNGTLEEGKINITFNINDILSGRGDREDHSGTNDTGIIFGAAGIKDFNLYNNYGVNDIEDNCEFYFLYFAGTTLSVAKASKYNDKNGNGVPAYQEPQNINDGWASAVTNPETNKGLSVNVATALGNSWLGIKESGKIKLSVQFTTKGAVKVWVNDNLIDALCSGDGTVVPFGNEVGIRNGMGFHVPTRILNATIAESVTDVPSGGGNDTPDTPVITEFEGWTAKVGSISALEDGLFQIDGNKLKAARQAVWNKYMTEGKISVTFDTESIFSKRAPDAATNPGTGSSDVAVVFGGKGIYASKGQTVNNIENISQYYVVMFCNDNLRIARVNFEWQSSVEKFPAAVQVNLDEKYGDQWTAIKESGKIKLTVEFTEKGAVKVSVGDIHVTELDRVDGDCVPYGGEISIRTGMGYHVPTKIFDVTVEGNVSEEEIDMTPEAPSDPGDDPTDTPDDPTGTPDDPTGTPDDPTDTPDDPADTPKDEAPKDEAPKDDENNDDGSMTWIIIAAVAAVVIIVAVIGVLVAKKKKA